jgi:hypothetical protein
MDSDSSPDTILRRLLAAACGASAGFHAALAPAHADDAEVSALFAASALALLLLAVAIEFGRSTLVLVAAGAVLTGLIAAYTASRVGVVWPLDHREPLDAIGVITKLFEAIGLALVLRLLQIQRATATVSPGETQGVHT